MACGEDDLFELVDDKGLDLAGAGEGGAWARDADVDVEVGDGVALEPGKVRFYPFGGALKTEFFGVPGAKDAVYTLLAC